MYIFLRNFFIVAMLMTPAIATAADATIELLTLGSLFGNYVGDLPAFFNRLFNVALFIGATLAVVVIAFAGIEYMMSDAVGTIKDAKDRMAKAILGLLMLLSVYIFYDQINPNILNIDFKLDVVTIEGKVPDNPHTLVDSEARAREVVRNADAPIDEVRIVPCSEDGSGGLPRCASVNNACAAQGYPSVGMLEANVKICARDGAAFMEYYNSLETPE